MGEEGGEEMEVREEGMMREITLLSIMELFMTTIVREEGEEKT
jgi:hypothetical protein